MPLFIKRLDPDAVVPQRPRALDAGYDLSCLEGFVLLSGERKLIKTGLAIALEADTAGLVIPRSGLAAKHGITVVNSPGLIDPSYRGELMVILQNTGDEPFAAEKHSRIAQLLIVDYHSPRIEITDELPVSDDGRGESGFGSSGL